MPIAYAQVLGTSTGDSTPSVLVAIDNTRCAIAMSRGDSTCKHTLAGWLDFRRVVINAGEGLQRQCMEHRVRLARCSCIALTHLDYTSFGGLPGMTLTLADMGRKSMRLVAPPGLTAALLATRPFLRRADVTLTTTEVYPAPPAADAAPLLSSVPLEGGSTLLSACVLPRGMAVQVPAVASVAAALTPPPTPEGAPHPDATRLQAPTCPLLLTSVGSPAGPRQWPVHATDAAAAVKALTPAVTGATPPPEGMHPPPPLPVALHAVVSPPQRGKFHPKRALALGVPKGPSFGALSRGEAVTLPSGATVRPGQCKDPDVPGVAVVVVPCPTADHLEAVAGSALWDTWGGSDPPSRLVAAFHTGPVGVVSSPAYLAWVASLGPSVTHVFLNEHMSSQAPVFRASAAHATALHLLHPRIFPLPHPHATAPESLCLPQIVRRAQVAPLPPATATPTLDMDAPAARGTKRKRKGGGPPTPSEPYAPVQDATSVPVDGKPLAQRLDPAVYGGAGGGSAGPLVVGGQPLLKLHLLPAQREGVVDVAFVRDTEASAADVRSHLFATLSQPGMQPLLPALAAALHARGGGRGAAAAPTSPASVQQPLPGGATELGAALALAGAGEGGGGAAPPSHPPPPGPASAVHSVPPLELGAPAPSPHPVPQSTGDDGDEGSDADLTPHTHARPTLAPGACAPTPEGEHSWTFKHAEAASAAASAAGIASAQQVPLPASAAVAFLGTGSALPSKYRNVTGVWARTPTGAGMLLDAGEGTFGQLVRLFGRGGVPAQAVSAPDESLPTSAADAVARLGLAWISHMHADHHLGLPRILAERPATCPPLVILAPSEMRQWLLELSAIMPSLAGKWRFLPCAAFDAFPGAAPGRVEGGQSKACRGLVGPEEAEAWAHASALCGFHALHTARVVHCDDAWALRLQGGTDWSLTVSGDCRPCDSVAALAAGTSLLVHEATFADGAEIEAVAKRHATAGEALHVAATAQAQATLLYHFSQRYPKLPAINPASKVPVCVAYDFMTVTGADLPSLPALWPALCAVYASEAVQEGAA